MAKHARTAIPCAEKSIPRRSKLLSRPLFVGTGSTYTSTERDSYRYPYDFYRYKSSGRYGDATVSAIAFTVDDSTPIVIPSDAQKSAYISTSTYGFIP
jgi:hypothetical protein